MTDYAGLYERVANTGAAVGPYIFGAAMATTVAIFTALGVLLARSRPPDAEQGKTVTDLDPVQQPQYFTGAGRMAFRTRRKVFFSRSGFVSVESVVRGTATREERLIVILISAAFFCVSWIMVGIGLMLMKTDASAGLLLPAGGLAFFSYYVYLVARDFRRIRAKVATSRTN